MITYGWGLCCVLLDSIELDAALDRNYTVQTMRYCFCYSTGRALVHVKEVQRADAAA